jgi:hypothetical protein
MGCDAANGSYFQLYSDERGVCRVYEMSISEGKWKLWRDGEPFAQRFSATISDEGNTIAGRWEKAPDGGTWETNLVQDELLDALLPHRKLPHETSLPTRSSL